MKFTFIVPVYNGEEYISQCLESIINQKYDNFEIIIINDGSTDKSEAILTNYQKRYPKKIKLISQINKGLSVSRNLGIKQSKGDYILFVDIDDYISTDTLIFLVEHLKKQKYDLVKFEWTNARQALGFNKKDNRSMSGNEAIKYLINKKKVFEMAVLYAYNKDFLQKINFQFKEKRFHEDFGTLPLTILKAKNILLTKKIMYYYNQNVAGSITNNDNYKKVLKKAYDILEFYKEINEELLTLKCIDKQAIDLLKSFNANAVLSKRQELKKEDKILFDVKIKQLKVINSLYSETLKGKIKKILYLIYYSF